MATEPAVRSDGGLAVSGSCTKQVFVVGLETGVPWTGGEGHGEPRGDTLEGGNPKKGQVETEPKTEPIVSNIDFHPWTTYSSATLCNSRILTQTSNNQNANRRIPAH